MPLTPQQKQHKRDIAAWQSLRNRCLSNWSFKKLKTYEDLLVESLGQDKESIRTYYSADQLAKPVTHEQIINHFEPFRNSIDWEHSQQNGSAWQRPAETTHDYEGYKFDPANITATEVSLPAKDSETTQKLVRLLEPIVETLAPSPKEKCFLFPFQVRAAKKLLDGILIHKKRGQLLRAAVGTGKTYIVGAVARRLLDANFHVGKTFSPWSYCWITRASIVEQTRRVLQEQFGIDTINELQVINIEQLRSSFGELMVRSETIIERGEEHIIWKWRKNVHPIVFFIDESQFAKNEDSTQSKIIQAIADIDNPNVYCIFFSATPLLRVVDAKYLVLNMHLQTKHSMSMEVAA